MKSMFFTVSALFAVLSVATQGIAAQLTSDFRDFDNPFLITYKSGAPPSNNLTTLGPVAITNSPAYLVAYGGSYIIGTPSDPADIGGWGELSRLLPITLNMSVPVQALGVTFDTGFNNFGSILAVYDGPNGTGQLLGQIQSVTIPPPWSTANQPIDFVGVIADSPTIRSARLIAQGSDSIVIRAMALSIPEPATATLFLMSALVHPAIHRRRRL